MSTRDTGVHISFANWLCLLYLLPVGGTLHLMGLGVWEWLVVLGLGCQRGGPSEEGDGPAGEVPLEGRSSVAKVQAGLGPWREWQRKGGIVAPMLQSHNAYMRKVAN